MEISYDKDADALYITLGKGPFAKNKKLDDYTILDLDEDDKVIGIEFLSVSERLPKEAFEEVTLKNLSLASS